MLNYGFFMDRGVIYCKDGSLLVGYFYKGADLFSAENEKINEIHTYIHQALNLFSDGGWILNFDTFRMKMEEDEFCVSDPEDESGISRFIENSMVKGEKFFTSKNTITLNFHPPSVREQSFTNLLVTGKEGKQNDRKMLDDFYKTLSNFENVVSLALKVKRMENRDLLRHVNHCICGYYVPMNFPDYPPVQKYPPFLNSYTGHNFEPGYTPRIDQLFSVILSIESFPEEISPGALAGIEQRKMEYRITHRFITLSQVESEKQINKFRRKWKQSIAGILGGFLSRSRRNNYAALMTEDAEAALTEAQSGEMFGLYTPAIVLFGKNTEELTEKAAVFQKELTRLGFRCRIEDMNANEALLGSLPANSTANIRRPLISSAALAGLIPISSIWSGERHCPSPMFPEKSPCLMTAKTSFANAPFMFNIHVDDVGHTLIFGPTGSGKSTLLAVIAGQKVPPKQRFYV